MIRVYGASDDLVEIEGDFVEEIGCFEKGVIISIGTDAGGLRIIAEYAPAHLSTDNGVWRLGVEPWDEDIPIPWPIFVQMGGRGYSPLIAVDCPSGTPIHWEVERG